MSEIFGVTRSSGRPIPVNEMEIAHLAEDEELVERRRKQLADPEGAAKTGFGFGWLQWPPAASASITGARTASFGLLATPSSTFMGELNEWGARHTIPASFV